MKELDSYDKEEGRKLSREELKHKLNVCKERKERYEAYRNILEESNEKQISLTAPDAKLMKANKGFCVGYNVQTAIDANSHMIASFQVTNSPTDHGQMTSIATDIKEDYGVTSLKLQQIKAINAPKTMQVHLLRALY